MLSIKIDNELTKNFPQIVFYKSKEFYCGFIILEYFILNLQKIQRFVLLSILFQDPLKDCCIFRVEFQIITQCSGGITSLWIATYLNSELTAFFYLSILRYSLIDCIEIYYSLKFIFNTHCIYKMIMK